VNIFEKYIPEVAQSLSRLTGEKEGMVAELLREMLSKNKEFILANAVKVQEVEKEDDIGIGKVNEDE
jgi:DNA topoisomerase VI subunit B